MLSSSRKKHLNKNTLFKTNPKSEYTNRDELFDGNSVSTSKKTVPNVRNSKKLKKIG